MRLFVLFVLVAAGLAAAVMLFGPDGNITERKRDQQQIDECERGGGVPVVHRQSFVKCEVLGRA
jgi:hypothetical protein